MKKQTLSKLQPTGRVVEVLVFGFCSLSNPSISKTHERREGPATRPTDHMASETTICQKNKSQHHFRAVKNQFFCALKGSLKCFLFTDPEDY